MSSLSFSAPVPLSTPPSNSPTICRHSRVRPLPCFRATQSDAPPPDARLRAPNQQGDKRNAIRPGASEIGPAEFVDYDLELDAAESGTEKTGESVVVDRQASEAIAEAVSTGGKEKEQQGQDGARTGGAREKRERKDGVVGGAAAGGMESGRDKKRDGVVSGATVDPMDSEKNENKDIIGKEIAAVSKDEQAATAGSTARKAERMSSTARGQKGGKPSVVGQSTSVKMTPEQIAQAKVAREAAIKVAEEKSAARRARAEKFLSTTRDVLLKVGARTRAFELGAVARARAENAVETAIKAGTEVEGEGGARNKVKASAASAAKAVIGAVARGWGGKVVPAVRERLPGGWEGVSSEGVASVALGVFVAVILLPVVWGGGGGGEKKQIEVETAGLEKKLERRDKGGVDVGSKGEKERTELGGRGERNGVFPPEDVGGRQMEGMRGRERGGRGGPPRGELVPGGARGPARPLPPPPSVGPPASTESTPPASNEMAPSAAKEAAPPAAKESVPSVARETAPAAAKESAPAPSMAVPKPAEVTADMVLSSIVKVLGTDAGIVGSASFDTLRAEPTVIVEVSKAFHKLAETQQKRIADQALKSTRQLGYDRVVFIERGTGAQVAQAGVDIALEDETENLRAELNAVRKQSDKLAVQASTQEAQLSALRTRLDEERDEFAGKRGELENTLGNVRQENAGLVEDLREAKQEIARMPDRLDLERRTMQAERKTEKLEDTVDMLSLQVAKARNGELQAREAAAAAEQAAKVAQEDKGRAEGTVAAQVEQGRETERVRGQMQVAQTRREGEAQVAAANERAERLAKELDKAREDGAKELAQMQTGYEKRLGEEQRAREQQTRTIQEQYETRLLEVQRKATMELEGFQREADRRMEAGLKEAKTMVGEVVRERDAATREVTKVESREEKAATKAAKEKEALQAKIAKLEARGKEGTE